MNNRGIVTRASELLRSGAVLVALMATIDTARAQKYKPEDPVPPNATAKILPVAGKVTEIQGLRSSIAGRASGLEAMLKDLGARVTEQEITIELSADALFEFDKADLRADAASSLTKVSAVLKAYPTATARVEGHADGVGNDAYNQRLSERRAESVKTWLAAAGAANPISTRGWGRSKPAAPNTKPNGSDNPEGRQKNRRVEITVKKG